MSSQEPPKFDELSQRQKETLRLIARHFLRKEIARELQISEHTVKAHIDAARKKLGVNTDKQAARLLVEFEAANSPASNGEYLKKGISSDADDDAPSRHEHALRSEPPLHADQLDGTRERHKDDGRAGETGPGGGHPPRGANPPPHGRFRESDLPSGSRDSLADGYRALFVRRLKSLTVSQSVGLIMMIAIGLSLAVILLTSFAATFLQALQNLTGQTR